MRYTKEIALIAGLTLTNGIAFAQQIKVADVTKTISFLASDEMNGRKVYSPEIDKAAEFIATEFKKPGFSLWRAATTFSLLLWLALLSKVSAPRRRVKK
ncbi:hypothetical protein [Niabella hibiscisoli]|uniref:hypothetical protein n=1 Tax=Niabella hibiscisoli TaxID=1825928 RepID=UPI001F0F64B7|nr:hypothetical protein [Niabella hibiscisoli]MCH5721434.1 hypothetical protein [Niabella hibiscisoli]